METLNGQMGLYFNTENNGPGGFVVWNNVREIYRFEFIPNRMKATY